jgi:hypothetical protein
MQELADRPTDALRLEKLALDGRISTAAFVALTLQKAGACKPQS